MAECSGRWCVEGQWVEVGLCLLNVGLAGSALPVSRCDQRSDGKLG